MMKQTGFKAVLCGLILLFGSSNVTIVHAYSLSFFSPATYNTSTAAMDAALGITGYQIEDFEDSTLLPGLSYTIDGSIASPITYNSVPASFNGSGNIENWDGPGQITNLVNNTCTGWPSNCLAGEFADRITVNISGGAASVGAGLMGFQSAASGAFPITDHTLYINGTAVPGTFESLAGASWSAGPFIRNLYLVIGLDPGDALITSFGFENISANDALHLDHVAIQTSVVPVPAAVWLFGTALAGLIGFSRRRTTA